MLEKIAPPNDPRSLLIYSVAIFLAWFLYMIIREYWCWYFKTNAIKSKLESINTQLQQLQVVSSNCQRELQKVNLTLAKVVVSRPTDSKGQRPATSEGKKQADRINGNVVAGNPQDKPKVRDIERKGAL